MKIVTIKHDPIFGSKHAVVEIAEQNQQYVYNKQDKKSATLFQYAKQTMVNRSKQK